MASSKASLLNDDAPTLPAPDNNSALRLDLQTARAQRMELQKKLRALRQESAKSFKSDGDLTKMEIAAFLSAFSSSSETIVKSGSFFVRLPDKIASEADDLSPAAFDAVNEIQMECLRDLRINGTFGLKWIYANLCPTASPRLDTGADDAKLDSTSNWPQELRIATNRHFKLIELLVKLGHMSLMEQQQRRQLEVIAIKQMSHKLQKQETQLTLLRLKQKQQARHQAARQRLLGTLKGMGDKEALSKDLMLKTVQACRAIAEKMESMDPSAQAAYMKGLSEQQKDQLADLSVLQQLL